MGKLIAFLAVVAVLAAFLAGVLTASKVDTAPIVNAVATEQAVKADEARARAAAAWAGAREAESGAEAMQASVPQIAFGIQALAVALPALVLCLVAVFGCAAARWAWRQGNVFYPRAGVSPILMVKHRGAVYLIVAARSLGGVTAIAASGGVKLPLAGPAEIHAQLSAQSLATAVIAQAAGNEAKTQAAAVVGRAVQDALGSQPALAQGHAPQIVFSSPQKSDGGDLHIIKRNVPTPTPGTVKRGHMAEFIKRGAVVGFGRRDFAGFKFSDGAMCSQTTWAALSKAARDAGMLAADGPRWKLAGTVGDALAQLGLEEFAYDSTCQGIEPPEVDRAEW